MYTVTIWNTESTNFGANSFVAKNGTGVYTGLDRERALRLMGICMHDHFMCKAVMEGGKECLIWTRANNQYGVGEDPCECDECDCDSDTYPEQEDEDYA